MDGKHNKLISVIVPCYNVYDLVDKCIESLVNQTIGLDKLQLILVDDASTDSTFEKLCSYERKYPENIIVIHCDQNGKQGTARNIGLAYATGDYIGFVDSDDWVELDMYEKLYSAACEGDYEIVQGGVIRDIDGHEEIVASVKDNIIFDINDAESRLRYIKDGADGFFYSCIYERDFLLNSGIRFLEGIFYEDIFFVGAIKFAVKRVLKIKNNVYHYRYNPQSTMSGRNALRHLDRLQSLLTLRKWYKNHGLFAEYGDYIDAEFVQLFYLNSLHMFFTRFDRVPVDIFNYLQKQLIKEVPDHRDAYCRYNEYHAFLNYIDQNMTQEWLDRIQVSYLEDIM